MNVLVPILNIGLLGFITYYAWKREKVLKVFYWPAVGVKVLCGIALGLLYKYYYTIGDTFTYFEEGKLLRQLAARDFQLYLKFLWQTDYSIPGILEQHPRAVFFSKIISIFNILTYDNYWVMTIYLSLISFAAGWFLVKVIQKLVPDVTIPAVVAFLFFPSVVFWSSGIIKESASMAALFFLSASGLKIWFRQKVGWAEILLMVVSVWILWSLKYYIVAVFFLCFVTAFLCKTIVNPFVKPSTLIAQIAVYIGVAVLPLSVIFLIHPNFYPHRFLEVIVENYNIFHSKSQPGDVIFYTRLEPTVTSMLINAPKALVSGLFRPFAWESANAFQFFAAVENTVIVVALFFSFRTIKQWFSTEHRLLVFATIFYVVIVCLFLSLSTPNFGTLSRYRIAYLPFFLTLILSTGYVRNFLQRWLGSLVGYRQ